MPIKRKFNDTFLDAYLPAAEQGSRQYLARQQMAAEQQRFDMERQDAQQRQAQQQAMQQQQIAFGQGQATRGMHLNERQFEGQQLDRAQSNLEQVMARQEPVNQAHEIEALLSRGQQDEMIQGDAQLARMYGDITGLAGAGVSPAQLTPMLRDFYGNVADKRTALQEREQYQSFVDSDIQSYQTEAYAAEQRGDYEQAGALRNRAAEARKEWNRGVASDPDKAGKHYENFSRNLHPYRSGGSTSKKESAKEKEPYSMAEALKLMQGSINEADAVRATKALKAQARKAGKSEEEIDDIEGPTVLELQREAARALMSEMNAAPPMQQPGARQPSQAQMRTQPGGMAQPMNGQQQAQAPAQAAPVQAPAQPAPRTAKEAGLAPEQASAMEEALFQAALSGKAPEGIEDLNSVPLDVRKRIAVRLAREQKKAKAAGDAASSQRASKRENVGPNF